MTKKIELCNHNLHGALKGATNLKNTVLPKDLKFALFLEVDDDLHKEIESDARLAEQIFKHVSKDYKAAVADLAKLATRIDVDFGKSLRPKGWVEDQWADAAQDILDNAEASMLAHSRDQIKKWQQVRKDRKKYVIKAASKVTIGVLNAATATLGSAVAIAGAGASFSAAAPGIIASLYVNVKAVAQLAKMLNRLRRDVDEAEKKLRSTLKSLVADYTANSKGKVAGKEMGKALVEQFLAVSMKSISLAETEMSDFKGKLDKVDIDVSNMSIKLNRIIDDQQKLNKLIETKLAKQLSDAGYKSKKLPKLEADVDKLASKLNHMIDVDFPDALKKVEEARKRYREDYKPCITSLKEKKPGWVDNAQLALKLGDLALGAGFTDFTAAESILVLVDSIAGEVDDVLAEKLL